MELKRTIIATIFAPLSLVIVVFALMIEGLIYNPPEISEMKDLLGIFLIFFYMLFSFIFIAYTFVIFSGIPFHLAMVKLKIKSLLPYLIYGTVLPCIWVYFTAPVNMPVSLLKTGLFVHGISGFIVSISFWYIVEKHERTKTNT